MNSYPPKAEKYIKTVIVTAVLLLVYLTGRTQFTAKSLQGLLFFGSLVVITNYLRIKLPKGGYVSVTTAVFFASIILFGPCVAAYSAIIGLTVLHFLLKENEPLHKLLFNCAQAILAIGTAGVVYKIAGGIYWDVNTGFMPLILAVIAFVIINSLAITLILAFIQNVSPWGIWLTNIKWAIPSMLTLPLLGLLMAYVYTSIGPLGVTLFFAPLLLARFIFKSYMDTREIFLNTLEAIASSLDAKDPYTKGHSDRVATYAAELARYLKLPEDQIEVIQHMAFLHDVGKIGVNDELLTMVGRFSDEEFAIIKLHSVMGADILRDIDYLGSAPDFVKYHHEKYDGSGYPEGLTGEAIPLGARIITLADSFDAMTSDRSYRKKMSVNEALAEVDRCAGTHFDPRLAKAFTSCWREKMSTSENSYLLEAAPSLEK